jgi:hypothetical protein
MPNWCENTVWAFGPAEQIDALLDAATDPATGQVHLCTRLLPVPDSIEKGAPITGPNGTSIPTLSDAEYAWTLTNWGVKWGDVDTTVDRIDAGLVEFRYDSPWGPITTALEAISMQYPDLLWTEQYHEPGMRLLGVNGIENGIVLETSVSDEDYPDWDGDDMESFYADVDALLDRLLAGREVRP